MYEGDETKWQRMPYRQIEPALEKGILNTENVIANVDGDAPFSRRCVA